MVAVKRVAVIGAGPSGAITIDALIRENVFDVIKVFERQKGPGGCWYVYSDSLSPRCCHEKKCESSVSL